MPINITTATTGFQALALFGGGVSAVGMPIMFALVWLKVMKLSVFQFLSDTVSVLAELLR